MNKATLTIIFLLGLNPLILLAEEKSLEQQIADTRQQMAVEQQINIELKAKLVTKETEVTDLKQKLKEIEEQIETLKKEHKLN